MRRHRPNGCFSPHYCGPQGMGPGAVSPMGVGPTAYSPMGGGPMGSPPTALGPTRVAPVQRVVHPTQYMVRQRTTRYPIEHIYPVHTHNVHNHVREHYHRTVCSESHQDCCYDVQCGSMPGRR